MAAAAASPAALLRNSIIPSFKRPAHKGAHGKLLIIGGSAEYTGAPYYAAVGGLKAGADLATVACVAAAATPIKCYCPELIVHAALPSTAGGGVEHSLLAMATLLDRCDCIVIGPGLGRDPVTLELVGRVIELTARRGLPTVVDGDGLFLLAQSPALVRGHPCCVLTPNAVEFKRLWDSTGASAAVSGSVTVSSLGVSSLGPQPAPGDPHDHSAEVLELSRRLGGVGVLRKGTRDVMAVAATDGAPGPPGAPAGALALVCVAEPSSPRRCGGQGDVLAGVLGTFLAWASRARLLGPLRALGAAPSAAEALAACGWGAATLTRTAASYAFEQSRRATVTPDIIDRIGTAFEDAFQDARG